MLPEPVYYSKNEYITTQSGNKVSRKSVLCGSQNIQLSGKSIIKPGVVLRGDLALLRIGKCVVIGENSVLRPPYKRYKGGFAYFPMTVGDYVMIGDNSVVSAALIGSFVDIGEDCIICKRCIIKDNAKILPGTVLAPDTVVPPFSVFGGAPGKCVGELPESIQYHNRVGEGEGSRV
eukprot:Cvel_28668.t1-p1 / transcript=Cvel_28668.t1 / gene=Cvel_28668 / organism=Chromera_velia_CCMP2878 / gene_product=Dynactin subunit 5, putative / transcript_product=Dynactin subunit 5, putative / location=Cvel_scaffold3797:334-3049(-) / protein_length=175 / sequence_SO=supercontig / SO=protein_coding / is_pseudo=false